MTKKLFRDVNLETPFNCIIDDVEVQVVADEADSVEIGGETFIKLTDGSGHNVVDADGKQLLLNDGIIYKVVEGVPESTTITVTDVVPVEQYTFTISATPNDATVVINGEARSSLTADDGTEISWSVAKEGYVTQSGTYTLNGENHTETVTLVIVSQYTFNVTTNMSSPAATVTINGEVRSSITANDGTSCNWRADRQGAVPQSGTYTLNGSDHTENITMNWYGKTAHYQYDEGLGDYKQFDGTISGDIGQNAQLHYDTGFGSGITSTTDAYNVSIGFKDDHNVLLPFVGIQNGAISVGGVQVGTLETQGQNVGEVLDDILIYTDGHYILKIRTLGAADEFRYLIGDSAQLSSNISTCIALCNDEPTPSNKFAEDMVADIIINQRSNYYYAFVTFSWTDNI